MQNAAKSNLKVKIVSGDLNIDEEYNTLFMWTCCWYCFCFSRKCWCCCWMTSWASVFWGSGADWVRFKGRCFGSLGRLLEGRSFMASGDWGWDGMEPWPWQKKKKLFKSFYSVSRNIILQMWYIIFEERARRPTRGEDLLLPHLFLLEEVLEESLVTGAHLRLQACLKGHRPQEMPRQAMLDFCWSVFQPDGRLRGQMM